ncbi:hypothetical protein C8R46DRAFT_1208099 [Mycena filopes]|nr:hypothetical protein C8R46DRAFT_1208099 [Mycena filopes]
MSHYNPKITQPQPAYYSQPVQHQIPQMSHYQYTAPQISPPLTLNHGANRAAVPVSPVFSPA